MGAATITGRWLRGIPIMAVCVVSGANRDFHQHPTITVDDPRPLASAIEIIEKRHGWVVTYEDPPLQFPGDVADVTHAVRKDGDYTKRVLVPKGGPFTFSYPGPPHAEPPPAAILQTLLDAYHSSGNPGRFRLVRTGAVFHVVPSMSRSASGAPVSRHSLLDVHISVAERSRSAMDMLQAIMREVTSARMIQLSLGTVPLNLLAQTTVRHGAENEAARTVILRTLGATNRALSWQLFCDPGTSQSCVLNLHEVVH